MMGFVLEHGFAQASLRPLAKAAGTSDRMLIYHFGSKDSLVSDLLVALAQDFTDALDAALPEAPMPSRRALMKAVLKFVRAPKVAAYVRVWQEVTTEAAKGHAAHIETGKVVVQGFVDWLERRMPLDDPDPNAAAQAMLTVIEGIHVMDGVGRGDVAETAVNALFPSG